MSIRYLADSRYDFNIEILVSKLPSGISEQNRIVNGLQLIDHNWPKNRKVQGVLQHICRTIQYSHKYLQLLSCAMSENHSSSRNSSLLQEQFQKSRSLKESVISHFDHSKYSIMNKASHSQTFVFEFLGMFLFTYGYSCSISISQVDVEAAGSLFLAMVLTGPVCGANLNPVITVANFLKNQNKYKGRKVVIYLIAQLLGALAGLFWSGFLGHKQLSIMELGDGMDIFRVISNEAMGVFFYVLFMLILSNPNTTFIDDQLSGYASIVIFYHISRSFAPKSGLVINPAVTLASAIRYATKGNTGPIANSWAWVFGDFVGVILACFFYQQLFQPIVRTIRQIKRKSELQNCFFEGQDEQEGSHRHILDEPQP